MFQSLTLNMQFLARAVDNFVQNNQKMRQPPQKKFALACKKFDIFLFYINDRRGNLE